MPVGINLSPALLEKVDRACQALGLSRSEFVRKAVETHLDGYDSVGGWRALAQASWQEAVAEFQGRISTVDVAVETLRNRINELRAHQASLEREREELLDGIVTARGNLNVGDLAQARERLARLESELQALSEVLSEAEKRLGELLRDRQRLISERFEDFRRRYEDRLRGYLQTRTENFMRLLAAFYSDWIRAIQVTRQLPSESAVRQLLKWPLAYGALHVVSENPDPQLNAALRPFMPFSPSFRSFDHVWGLVRSDFKPREPCEVCPVEERPSSDALAKAGSEA